MAKHRCLIIIQRQPNSFAMIINNGRLPCRPGNSCNDFSRRTYERTCVITHKRQDKIESPPLFILNSLFFLFFLRVICLWLKCVTCVYSRRRQRYSSMLNDRPVIYFYGLDFAHQQPPATRFFRSPRKEKKQTKQNKSFE
jgi:hypothetical protein